MTRRMTSALALLTLLTAWVAYLPAQGDPTPPAVLQFVLPDGATLTANGTDYGAERTVTVGDLKPSQYKRVKAVVTFANGTQDERLVDVAPGQRLVVPVPQPGPEKAAIVGMQPLVPINSTAIRRDGRYIAVGLEDRNIVLWDTAEGRPVRSLVGHQKPVLSVAFSPDDRYLLSSSGDATAVLWDVEAGSRVRTYKGHTGPVTSARFSPKGDQLFTGSQDGTAILWNAETGERVHTIKSKGILCVAYSPDGTTLATSSSDRTATLWEAATGKQKFVLRGHREDVNCVGFSPDGKRVLTGSSDDSSVIWDAATGKRIGSSGKHTNNIHSAVFTPDGRRVITGEREELVIMWEAANAAKVWTFVGHSAEILSILPRPDGSIMLTGSRDGTARLWDLATGRELLALTTDGTRRTWAVVSPDGLFDGSAAGRSALGYRFLKMPGGVVDQFFAGGYRPGLLAQVWRGERPLPARPLGQNKPPLVNLVVPKKSGPPSSTTTLMADVTDQGGGASNPIIENNGVRLAIPTKSEPAPGANATRYTFTVSLVPGLNKIRVRSAARDGSWESAAEMELSSPRAPGQRGRMYVVAIGISGYAEKVLNLNYPAKDSQALGELLRTRGQKLYERVDVVPILDRDATRATIEDTVKDVAELTRAQDTLVVIMCGQGARTGERVYFAPYDLRTGADRPKVALQRSGVAIDDVVAAMGTAAALGRVLVVDVASSGEVVGGAPKERLEFGLRGAVERWGRSHGVHILASVAATSIAVERSEVGRGLLTQSLLDAAGRDAMDVTDWVESAADRANSMILKLTGTRQEVQAGTRSKGFPLLASDR